MHVPATIERVTDDAMVFLRVSGLASWLQQAKGDEISLRFAASSMAGVAQLVIGLRQPGMTGVDLLLPADQCELLLPEPQTLVIGQSDPDTPTISVNWDEERFEAFLELVSQMRAELPDHAVWRALDAAFK